MAKRHQHLRKLQPSPYEQRGAYSTGRGSFGSNTREASEFDPRYRQDDEYLFENRHSGNQPYGEHWRRHGHYEDSNAGRYPNREWMKNDRYQQDQGYDSLRKQGPDYSYQQGPYYGQNPDYYGYDQHNEKDSYNNRPENFYDQQYRPREHRGQSDGYNERNWWDRTKDEVSSWFGDEQAQHRRNRDLSDQNNGIYRGVGPRGYQRSDERIKDDINDRLSDDPYVDASDIEVLVENGDVTLSGTVMSKSIKRRAEDIAESVSAVKNVENRIRISPFSKDGQQISEQEEKRNAMDTQRQSRQKGSST